MEGVRAIRRRELRPPAAPRNTRPPRGSTPARGSTYNLGTTLLRLQRLGGRAQLLLVPGRGLSARLRVVRGPRTAAEALLEEQQDRRRDEDRRVGADHDPDRHREREA